MKRTQQHVSNARQQLEQRRARLEASEARLRKREDSTELRRKILAGAWLFSRLGTNVQAWPAGYVAALDAFLTRPHDRRTLGFADQPSAATAATPLSDDANSGG